MDRYKTTFETWNNVATIYQDFFMDLDLYSDTYDSFCELVKKRDPAIFEIGCGPGNITRYLLAQRPDFRIEAIDIAPNMIELAKKNNPEAKFRVMDCREIDQLNKQFDAVICGFCMPYLSEPDCAKFITDCGNLLVQNGIFYFSTIEGDHARSGYETGSSGQDKMFVYYYPEEFLLEKLKANHFELIDLQRKSFPKKDGTLSTHLIFIARKT